MDFLELTNSRLSIRECNYQNGLCNVEQYSKCLSSCSVKTGVTIGIRALVYLQHLGQQILANYYTLAESFVVCNGSYVRRYGSYHVP